MPISWVGRRGVKSGTGYTRGSLCVLFHGLSRRGSPRAVGMGAGLGIGLVAASHGSTGTPHGPATTGIASSAQWAGGAELARDSGRNWAYESIPIDVKGKR